MTAAGASPIAIAKVLNTEKIPGPTGGHWADTAIRGHALRGTGILRNEMYIGRRIWNRMRFIKDPMTGNRVSRMNPPEEWVIEDMPDLRIIDQAVWEGVQRSLSAIRTTYGADLPDRPKFHERRRAKHILSGKVFCGVCGGVFAAVGQNYLACNAARKQGICDNIQSIRRDDLDTLVLDGLRNRLMRPEHVEEFVREFTAEWNSLQAIAAADHKHLKRELESVDKKLAGLIDAMSEGFRAPSLQAKLTDLEDRKATLERQLAQPAPTAIRMHPNLAQLYKQKVADLESAFKATDNANGALDAIRALVERIELKPNEGADGLEIELIGEIAAMIALGSGHKPSGTASDPDVFLSSVKVVAGARFERAAFRL